MRDVKTLRRRWQRGVRAAVTSALGLACLGGLLFTGLPAAEAQTVITFDNLSSGTQLTNQYAADGVTFGVAAPGQAPSGTMLVEADSSAFSPPNDVLVQCGEVCQTNMWAEFSSPQQTVSMELNNEGVNGTVSSTVNAYDASGNLVASTPFTAPIDQWQQVTVTDPTDSIIYVEVVNWETGCCPAFAMDNFSFSGATHPDFALLPTFDPTYGVGAPVGGSANISFTLRRYGGSAGNISFSTSSLPAGVTLSLSPNPDSNSDDTSVQGTITVAPNAAPVSSQPVTITATPDSTSGTTPRTVTFPLTVQGTYELRVQGMEITQGVQNTTLPTRNPANLAGPVSYSGVQLVDGKATAVRVFADAPGAPAGGILGVGAELTGFRANGSELGTLNAAYSPSEAGTGGLADTGSATVPASERDSTNGSFDFLLPASWNGAAAKVQVTLTPPNTGLFGPLPASILCTTAACDTLASMTMDNITYTNTGDLKLGYVLLTNNGVGFPLTESAFDWTRLIPDGDQSGYLAPAGTLDIGWVLSGCPTGLFGDLCTTRSEKNGVALSELEDDTANAQTGLGNSLVQGFLGVTNTDLGVEDGSTILSGRPDAVVDVNRPVTDIDHEIGHMLGLPHASADCGGGANGQPSESWPPDQHGYINSIGLDITGVTPFPVVAGSGGPQTRGCALTQSPPQCGGAHPAQYYDFMSYCTNADPNADGTLGSTDAWVSARNWNAMVAELAKANSASQARRLVHAAEGPPGAKGAASMRVYGFSDPKDGTHITLVDPTPTSTHASGSASSFTVVAESGKGKALATGKMRELKVHVDGVGGAVLLQGTLPLSAGAAAAKLQIRQARKVVATMKRPATAPKVTIKSAPGRTCSAKAVTISWGATDKTKAHLSAAVDFSPNGGKNWAEVYGGAAVTGKSSGAKVTIPRSLLATTKQGEVRVRVSDGYNQVMAHTARFCVAAVPPVVSIISPAADQLVPGQKVELSGAASDNGNAITGPALTWRAEGPGLAKGGIRLGSGSPLVATLPASTTAVALTATSGGKSATATEQVGSRAIPLRLQNGWTAAPSGTAKPSAAMVAGIVHLQGAMATSKSDAVAFTLPAALRPTTGVYVPVDLCNASKGRLFIQPDGVVTVEAETSFADAQCLTSLDGASYVLQATTPLVPLNGWTGAPFGTSQPAATLVSGVVHLRGAIATNTSNDSQWVFTLPPAMRPATDVYVPVDLCDAANGRLLVEPDGMVNVQAETSISDAQCFTSLDGASFALTAGTRLTTINGWSGAPFGTSEPEAALIAGVVQFKGAISTTGTSTDPFTLPAGLRPAKDVYVPVDMCNATNGRLLIKPDGVVSVRAQASFSDAQCFTSLDGVSFVR